VEAMDVCTGQVTIRGAGHMSARTIPLPGLREPGQRRGGPRHWHISVYPAGHRGSTSRRARSRAPGGVPWHCLSWRQRCYRLTPVWPARRLPACASARLMACDLVTGAERTSWAEVTALLTPPRAPRYRRGRCQAPGVKARNPDHLRA